MPKPCKFFFHNQNKTLIFTINKPNIMKKSKYQKYFYYFIVCILILYAFSFSYQQNIVTILISALFRGAALIRGEEVNFKVDTQRCGAYFRSGAYQRKYGNYDTNFQHVIKYLLTLVLKLHHLFLIIYDTYKGQK